MTLIERLLDLSDVYCTAAGLSEARVSTLIFNDGKKLRNLREGRDLGTRAHERAIVWFSENWPEGSDWPAGIERPSVAEAAE